MKRLSRSCLSIAALVFLAGCGGGGGGGPKVSATILWPQRSKATTAPSSALSVAFTLSQTGSTPVTWIRNRAADPSAHEETYQSDKSFPAGPYTLTVTFYSKPEGIGSIVGQATKALTVTAEGATIPDLAVGTRVVKVNVTPNQSVAIGAEKVVDFTALDSSNNEVVLEPGSALLQVIVGTSSATIVENRVKGVALGLIQVKATVDGVSGNGVLGVGSPSYSVNATGARGLLPIVGGDGVSHNVDGTTSAAVTSGWFATNVAPARYADRVFSKWKIGTTDLATTPTLTGLPGNVNGGTLTAVYTVSLPGDGIFAPNYNVTDYGFWPSLPVKVWIDPAFTTAYQDLILAGISRWKNASGGAIDFTITTTQSQGQIKIVPHTSSLATDIPTGRKGITSTSGIVQGPLLKLTASVATLKADEPIGSAQNLAAMTAVASHEFGHALGIIGAAASGHSTNAADTMFPTSTKNTLSITERDINTIANIYPERFGVTRSRPAPSRAAAASGEIVTRIVSCP